MRQISYLNNIWTAFVCRQICFFAQWKWIAPGTVIVSDCWKAYCNLEKHGYVHRTVNHSKEFVNENGDNTKKIEGHWRQAKCKRPKFGVQTSFSYIFGRIFVAIYA